MTEELSPNADGLECLHCTFINLNNAPVCQICQNVLPDAMDNRRKSSRLATKNRRTYGSEPRNSVDPCRGRVESMPKDKSDLSDDDSILEFDFKRKTHSKGIKDVQPAIAKACKRKFKVPKLHYDVNGMAFTYLMEDPNNFLDKTWELDSEDECPLIEPPSEKKRRIDGNDDFSS